MALFKVLAYERTNNGRMRRVASVSTTLVRVLCLHESLRFSCDQPRRVSEAASILLWRALHGVLIHLAFSVFSPFSALEGKESEGWGYAHESDAREEDYETADEDETESEYW